MERNGRGLVITLDAPSDRIDVAVNHGIVTATGVY
jgi:hypothetical protein